MTVLDVNILLYAYNADAPEHATVRKWLDGLLASREWIGLTWLTLWAFLRITTNPRIFPRPLSVKEAFEITRRWLELPTVVLIEPGARHASLLERLAIGNQAGGPLLTDAVLAAIALEHGAVVASTDRDFSRFSSIQWVNPIGHSAT